MNKEYLWGDRFFEFWGKSFNFTGKTNRRDYWITVLQLFFIYLLFYGLLGSVSLKYDYFERFIELSRKSFWIVGIITFIPNLAIQVRRLNDIGKEPAWVLLSFVPFLSLILIFWYAKPSLKNQSSFRIKDIEITLNQENTSDKLTAEISSDLKNDLKYSEEQLKKITSMLERGLISYEEYEALRKKTLGL